MKKEEAKNLPKYKANALLKGLPTYLKDPANYDKVRRALLDTLASKHSHSELGGWAKCPPCMKRVNEHKMMMVKRGFKTPAHYMVWKRIMHIMTGKNTKRVPLK